MPTIDAIVTAGGVPAPDEPLYPLTQGQPKALLPLAGQPMVQWPLDALGGAEMIRRVAVAGLTPEQAAPLRCAKPWGSVPNQGDMIANIVAGGRWSAAQGDPPTHYLLVSGDVPLVTAAMLDWIVRTALETDHDLYYSLIPQAAMEARFPGSRRTFFRLKEGRFTAGDVTLAKAGVLSDYHPAWTKIVAARKSLIAQARLVGLDTFLLVALGRLSIPFGQQRIRERLGVDGRVLINPFPEVGMDVDKPRQYAMLRQELERRV
ncbi:MAG: nucleotidyltransferase family protein [Anaerolineales bacterium]|nr:nucleotidyltransferase family protein [Anaerolineales bacterium]